MVLLGPTIQSSSSPGASFQMAAHIMYLLKDCYLQNNLNLHCLEPLACKCPDHRYAKLLLELLAHHFIKYARMRVFTDPYSPIFIPNTGKNGPEKL